VLKDKTLIHRAALRKVTMSCVMQDRGFEKQIFNFFT